MGERLELGQQLGAPLRGERRGHADVVQRAVVVVQAEQQRADAVAVLVHAVAGDHAIGGAPVLHLHQRALVGRVRVGQALGDDAVEPGALELDEPPLRAPRRSVVDGHRWIGAAACVERVDEQRVPRRQRLVHAASRSPSASRSNATNDAGVSAARRRTRDSAGWMRCSSASKSRPRVVGGGETISPSTTHRCGQLRQQRREQLGEVAGERPLVAAGQLDVVAVAEHDAAEAVPLRLVQPAVAHRGSSSASLASIGAIGGDSGSVIAPIMPHVHDVARGTAADVTARPAGH